MNIANIQFMLSFDFTFIYCITAKSTSHCKSHLVVFMYSMPVYTVVLYCITNEKVDLVQVAAYETLQKLTLNTATVAIQNTLATVYEIV